MGAPDLLQHLRGAGFTVTPADGDGIRIAPAGALTDDHRQAIRNHRAALLALLARTTPPTTCASPAPESLALLPAPAVDPDRWCWPHSDAMNGAELQQFAKRAQQFTRRGMSADAADAMADRLVIRDRASDDRRACLECGNHRPGRCSNHRAALLQSPEVGRDLAVLLQRCPGFRL